MWLFPLTASLVTAIAAVLTARFWLRERDPQQLAWAAALIMFTVASVCMFIGSFSGWTPLTAKIFYLIGPATMACYLSVGVLYLLAPRLIAHIWLLLLIFIYIFGAVLQSGLEVNSNALSSDGVAGWKLIESAGTLVGLVGALNTIGTLILVISAVVSYVYRRYAFTCISIASGAIIISISSGLERLGAYEYESIGHIIGIIIIFTGIFFSTRHFHTEDEISSGTPAKGE